MLQMGRMRTPRNTTARMLRVLVICSVGKYLPVCMSAAWPSPSLFAVLLLSETTELFWKAYRAVSGRKQTNLLNGAYILTSLPP